MMTSSKFWKYLDEESVDSNAIIVTTYSLYSAVRNYRNYNTGETGIPPANKRNPIQNILCRMNDIKGCIILNRLKQTNEDLFYNIKLWPNIIWRYAKCHDKIVVVDKSNKMRYWVGSANMTGTDEDNDGGLSDIMCEVTDGEQIDLVSKQVCGILKRSTPLIDELTRREKLKNTVI